MARGGDSYDLQSKGKGGEERDWTDLLFYSSLLVYQLIKHVLFFLFKLSNIKHNFGN